MLIVAWHSMSGTRPAEIADGNSSSGSGLGKRQDGRDPHQDHNDHPEKRQDVGALQLARVGPGARVEGNHPDSILRREPRPNGTIKHNPRRPRLRSRRHVRSSNTSIKTTRHRATRVPPEMTTSSASTNCW